MPEQGAEEERDLHVGDVLVRMEVEVQAAPPPPALSVTAEMAEILSRR